MDSEKDAQFGFHGVIGGSHAMAHQFAVEVVGLVLLREEFHQTHFVVANVVSEVDYGVLVVLLVAPVVIHLRKHVHFEDKRVSLLRDYFLEKVRVFEVKLSVLRVVVGHLRLKTSIHLA